MPSSAGSRGTGDWGTDERPKNFRELIMWRQPNGMTPLTALLSRVKSQNVDDPEFSWWEEELKALRLTTDATGGAAASTTLGVLSGGYDCVAGDLFLVEKADSTTFDNEIVEVSSIASDTSVVFRRGQCGTVAANTGASASLTKIGNRFEEGGRSPNVSTRNPVKLFNYAQICKTAYGVTETTKKTYARTGKALAVDKKRKSFDHAVGIELALLFGRRSEVVGPNGKPLRTTGGLRQFLTSNTKVWATTPTMSTFVDAITPMFDYSATDAGNERVGYMGNGFLNSLQKLLIGQSQVRINYDKTTSVYGMKFLELVLPQGTVYFKSHPLLNTHPRYTNSAFFIDPTNLKWRPLRDTAPQDNIQENDEDLEKGQWLTEAGLEVNHERTMGYLGNFVVP